MPDAVMLDAYDLLVLDLDGVVYIGRRPVRGASEAIDAAHERGVHVAFVTNNAARPPAAVAAHLREIGVPAADEDVVTSAQAAARLVARRVPEGSKVFVIGGPGLHEALLERGLQPVTDAAEEPVAVVQGYGPDMPWRQVIAGALVVKSGVPWVASNLDLTVPTERGPGPGNGTLVELVAKFAERQPEVAGKPAPPLLEETRERVGGERPLMIGDRIDTDIEGAHNVGWDSLLVMTGVTDLAELAAVPPELRPTYVGADLGCLLEPAASAEPADDGFRTEGWRARVRDGRLSVEGTGSAHGWWRVAAAALWAHLDATGGPADVRDAVTPR